MANIEIIKKELAEAKSTLDAFISDASILKIAEAGELLVSAFKQNKKVISCGNGGSMCDAMHFAEELSGRFRGERRPLAAIAISDPSYLTCTSNDYGFNKVFSRFVEGFGHSGDVLLAISTSGNSANIIEACVEAKKKGMKIIALTGKDGGKLAELADVEIRSPQSQYADRAQEIHIKVIHCLILYIEHHLDK